jgi:hypothetical protein
MEEESPSKPDLADGELLLYDYLKWITTLSLLTLGGVLSLAQSADIELGNFQVGMVLVPICIAGVTALSGADTLVRNRVGMKPHRMQPTRYMHISIGSLGIGVGAFLAAFWDALT